MSAARPSLLWELIACCILCFPGCVPGGVDNNTPNEMTRLLLHQGIQRTYQLYVPSGYDGTAMPLILVYHETFASGRDICRATRFGMLAEPARFIVAYPDAVSGFWNDGRAERTTFVDDVDFTRVLIDQIQSEFAIDLTRVYATGYSNGGHMVSRLAYELGETFAAVAPVASLLSVDLLNLVPRPQSRIPILLIHGTADPLTPFAGGPGFLGHGLILSAADTVNFWIGQTETSPIPQYDELPDNDPTDGTFARRQVHSPLNLQGAEVILILVEGGGHTWPGGQHVLPSIFLGPTGRDFSASDEIWNFFLRHAR